MVLRWYDFFARRPVWLAGGLALVLVVAALGATRLSFSEDILGMLPREDPAVAETRLALARFRGLERMVVALENDNPDALARDVDEAGARLASVPGVRAVMARLGDEAGRDIAALYPGKAPLLFDEPMRQAVAGRLTTAEFERRLQQHLDRQAGSEGISVADSFRGDPFGLDELVLRRFERLNSGFSGSLVGGRLFSADHRMAVVMVEPDFPAVDTGRGLGFVADVRAVLAGLPGGSQAHLIGAHASAADNATVLRRDLHLTIAASAAGVLLLFLVAFRSVTPMLLAALSAGFGFAVAMGTQAWARGEISALSAGFAGVLMAISLDCAIHLSAAFAGLGGSRDERARGALRHVALPSSLAVLTTIVAVATLRLSSFDGLHQLCELGIVGMAAALAFSLLAGPQLLRKAGPMPKSESVLGRLLGMAEAGRTRLRRVLLGLAGLATVGATVLLPTVGFDGDVQNLDGKSARTREAETRVQSAFASGGLRRTLVVSGGNTLDEALRECDLAARALFARGATYESAAWVLPARQTQRENLARWRAWFTEDRIAEIKNIMAHARATRPDGAEVRFGEAVLERRFAAFFAALRVAEEPQLLDAEALRARPLWALVGGFVQEREGRFWVGTTAQVPHDRLGDLRAELASALVVNKSVLVSRVVALIQRDLALMGGLSLALVVGLVWLTFRRARETLIALVPVLGSLLWTLGAMGALGIEFNIINTLVTVFIAGLGIDYGVFFVQTWRECDDPAQAPARLRVAGTGVLLAALVNLAGFGALSLAGHPALFSVGITTLLGIASSLGLTLFVVPTLLELCGRRDK
ncbi:MAG: MMPL family transporter [Planctomycetes bacterium]|nr:MMPL family transporter [Planctomycetota bacterium]MCL4730248.1 MMPL family transporter [Planctomycetota bacterium]